MLLCSGDRVSSRLGQFWQAADPLGRERDRRVLWPLLIKVDSCSTFKCVHGSGVSVSVPPEEKYITAPAQMAAPSDEVPAMAAVLRLLLPGVGNSSEAVSVGELAGRGRVEGDDLFEEHMTVSPVGVDGDVSDVAAQVHSKDTGKLASVKRHFFELPLAFVNGRQFGGWDRR